MAKSLRSKIKRKFRTELRKRVGVPHLVKQEAKIQENLKKAIAAQEGKGVLGLKKLMGTSSAPVAAVIKDDNDENMEVEDATDVETTAAEAEATLMNDESDTKKVVMLKRPVTKSKKKKGKFVHFHSLRKKGV